MAKIKLNKIGGKKKRPPIKQLIQAGKMAQKMLIEKGLQAKDSQIDRILLEKNSPPLPGVPSYLPRKDTLRASRNIAFDLLIMWKEKTMKNKDRMENVSEFFTFAVKRLQFYEDKALREHKAIEKEIKEFVKGTKEAPVLGTIFDPLEKYETTSAIIRFFVDSFAVAIMVKNTETTGQFAEWFFTWTEKLEDLWPSDKPLQLKNVSTESTGDSL